MAKTETPRKRKLDTVAAGAARDLAKAQCDLAAEFDYEQARRPDTPFPQLLARAALWLAHYHGIGRAELVRLASEMPEDGFEYRPLPEFGTPEFAAELDRRSKNPGRPMTIDECMARLNFG